MAQTSNESIRDAIIRHQVNLQRLSASMSDQVVRILDKTEASIVAEIRDALAKGASFQSSQGLRRLQALEDIVTNIRKGAFADIQDILDGDLTDMIRHEVEFTANQLDVDTPTHLDLTVPDVATVNAIVDEPFEGRVLGDWFDGIAADDAARIMDSVKVGLTRGLSVDDITRLVVGSTFFDGQDGATNLTRNRIDTLVRTAVNAFSNRARSTLIDANKDLVLHEMYHATLDSRTSAICRSLDGNIYNVGEGRFPPQHFNCRSVRVPVLDGTAVGQRPMTSATERTLVAEFAAANGLSARTRNDIPRGLKGKYDAFARARARELTGQTPAKTTYDEFLKRQSASFQDEVLGPTKGLLYRQGGLTLDKFVTRGGTELTLHQLVRAERAAFVRASLDPRRY